jgi:hypothetical protein
MRLVHRIRGLRVVGRVGGRRNNREKNMFAIYSIDGGDVDNLNVTLKTRRVFLVAPLADPFPRTIDSSVFLLRYLSGPSRLRHLWDILTLSVLVD